MFPIVLPCWKHNAAETHDKNIAIHMTYIFLVLSMVLFSESEIK